MSAQGKMAPPPPPRGPGPIRVEKEKPGRQSFSCAECRRLKLKCSRTWPCTSCEKRGCAQICPNGEMRTGKGKRLILANTEELHQRISLLEVALAQAHAKTTNSPHPLLSSTYLYQSREPMTPYPRIKPEGTSSSQIDEDEVAEGAFGTLTIRTEGEARFYGSFAGSEYLRDDDNSGSPVSGPSTPGVALTTAGTLATPPATAGLSGGPPGLVGAVTPRTNRAAYADSALALHDSFVPAGPGLDYDVEMLRDELPDWDEEGRALVESYWENVNWMYQIIPRPMFDQDHLINAYDSATVPNAHKLACVFLIMAIGVMFDLNRQPWDSRGERLFLLGRASISLIGLEHASPATCQALHLMGTYILNDRLGNGAEVFWPILGAAAKVAQSLGLHRDGSCFGLSPYEVEERRQVYWEIVTYDRLQAMCFGRPCVTTNRSSDAKFPEAEENLIADKDGYHRAKYRLMQMMESVIDIQTQTTPVSYAVVTQLDAELQEFKRTLPETLLPAVPIQELPLDRMIHPHLVIHRLGMRLLVAQTRLLLNRPSFVRALKDSPDDPSRSKFGESFIALYESAQDIVQLVKQLVIYHPSLIARWWFFWFHAFSSAVCLSAISIRAPGSAFASPAYHGMSLVCDISGAAREGCRAKNGLPILQRLRQRAHEALSAAARARRTSKTSGAAADSETENDLSHLESAPKLVRVGTSPPNKQQSLVRSPALTNNQSPRSATTSATLVDQPYDGAGPTFPSMTMPGFSNGPTLSGPMSSPPQPSSIGSTAFANSTWLSDISWAAPANSTSMPSEGNSALQYPSSYDDRLTVDTDMSMALGIDLSMSMPVSGTADDIGFDFEAFVHQLGGDRGFGP